MKRIPVFAIVMSLLCACTLTGCARIKQSLRWQTAVFVRVPGVLPDGQGVPQAPPVGTNGWYFKHILACPKAREPEAHWWMAWPDKNDPRIREEGIDKQLSFQHGSWFRLLTTGTGISRRDWRRVRNVTPDLAAATFAAFQHYPQMVHPDLICRPLVAKKDFEKASEKRSAAPGTKALPAPLELASLPASGWAKGPSDQPPFDPIWHMGEQYSQLTQAKEEVRRIKGTAAGDITIGILDTGFDWRHSMVPGNTIGEGKGEIEGDAVNMLACVDGTCFPSRPGEAHGEQHGLKAMSVLATGRHTLVDPKATAGKRRQPAIASSLATNGVEFGGAPDAQIVPVRVAAWVFSASTANLAYGIDYASRVKGCDVISLSHGGAPSALWIDAVNAAYDRGTALFAATGDYFNLAPINLGIIAPSATVFPAACRRVIGVAGVTANGEPYAKVDFKHYWPYYLLPWHWFATRGSFGADGGYRSLFHNSAFSMMTRADKAQQNRNGLLRTYPVSGYSPNIAAPNPPTKVNGVLKANRADLDWNGTSAAAPQAAAAAALWLSLHRDEIERAGCWTNWQKPESLYVAMLQSACPPAGAQRPSVRCEDRMPDLYHGAGALKAADMLKISFDDARRIQGSTLTYPRAGSNRDWYDGARSGAAVLGFQRKFPPYGQRADSRITNNIPLGQADFQHALENLYFNQLIVREWNLGHVPRVASDGPIDLLPGECLMKPKSWFGRWLHPDEDGLAAKAKKLAKRATKNHTPAGNWATSP